ncbi:MAG: proline dehydrogenase family protein [Ardenticatenaceae bacterium]
MSIVAKALLDSVKGGSFDESVLAEKAVALAGVLLEVAQEEQTGGERARAAKIAGMMDDPQGKALTMVLSDQAFRSHNPARIADQVGYLLQRYGVPRYFALWERLGLRLGALVGQVLPQAVVPAIVARLRAETKYVILPGEEKPLQSYLHKRRQLGTRLNLNQLGEAILGEGEAERRLDAYLDLLARPDVEYISVKISSIYSQINLVAFDETVEAIKGRLRLLYRAGLAHEYVLPNGESIPKFVNLDMEEYRDLHLTMAAFQQVLDEPEFHHFKAGIVLQAYLPDSSMAQQSLTAWARQRIAAGGAPIKIRIVKGANLAMEQVEAAWHGWAQAPYTNKTDVDANYKRMVRYGCQPDHARAAHLGIASHNLFDVAYALLLRAQHAVERFVEFEMLEGMANQQARAIQAIAGGGGISDLRRKRSLGFRISDLRRKLRLGFLPFRNSQFAIRNSFRVLLYAPVVKRDDFHSAIAYLVRRLDENTAPQNFLHDLFGLEVGTPRWDKQKQLFLDAVHRQQSVANEPRRQQNRATEQPRFSDADPFVNEPNTDWSLPANQAWIRSVVQHWQSAKIAPVPLQIGGQLEYHREYHRRDYRLRHHPQPDALLSARSLAFSGMPAGSTAWTALPPPPILGEGVGANPRGRPTGGEGYDPSHPNQVAYRYALAEWPQIDRALDVAVAAQATWQDRSIAERKRLLIGCASLLAARRADLIGAALLDCGKGVTEADVEVSEAVDFANYYARSFDALENELNECVFTPLGTVLITPPWNFPIAIPCGGMLAALMAGNTVILKPAPEAVLVAWELCNALWDAGIPQEVLQFVPTTDDEIGQRLVTDERVDAVILTGGYETAQMFLSWKPELRLLAETSGKNTLIITAMADHDQAIKDLVQSAFGHNGQKCSAASLAILEAEVYDNPVFLRQLRDAAASLHVGSAWDLKSKVTPLIREPGDALRRAQTTLEAGERWLLKPQMVADNPNLWSPAIKLGVKPGSFYHKTECFGPVLGLMRADNLQAAINMVNQSEFGLTSGLHSLDDREINLWQEQIAVGNAYINRGTTGAIVQRQPFGGWKKSAFGGGAKAGGPNYVLSLGTWRDAPPARELRFSEKSYQAAWQTHFSVEHDPSQVLGEGNIFRYRPISALLLRVAADTDLLPIHQVASAARICGVPLTVSLPPNAAQRDDLTQISHLNCVIEDDTTLAARLPHYERMRLLGTATPALCAAAHAAHVALIRDPVLANGRLELRHYLREQAITHTTHRYGNIL